MIFVIGQPDLTAIWDYGIAVGVIICSFILIWWMLNKGLEKFETIAATHSEQWKEATAGNNVELKRQHESHAQERKEWRAESIARENRIQEQQDGITSVLNNLIRDRDSDA